MATISMIVEKNNILSGDSPIGVFFTAPFDCIVGIEVYFTYYYSPRKPGIYRDKQYSVGSNATVEIPIASSVAVGTKISSIIMKSGESLRFYGTGFAAYITGVSA